MSTDSLHELRVSSETIAELTGLTNIDLPVVSVYRWLWRDRKSGFLPIQISRQFFLFVIVLMIALPLSLIIISRSSYDNNDPRLLILLAQITLGLAVVLTLGFNFYVYFQSQPLLTLANLLDEVQKYNQIISSLDIADQLASASKNVSNLESRSAVIEALKVARDSLICTLKTERIFRENRQIIDRKYELITNLQNNLTALMTFKISAQADHYNQLINDALAVGMNVQKEVKNLQQ